LSDPVQVRLAVLAVVWNKALQIVGWAFVAINLGLAAFVSVMPADKHVPWWVLPLVAALNAVAHLMPSNVNPAAKGTKS
jgi:hypothetical protein